MLKGIIFDMDGVLIDSEPVYLRETYDLLKKYGANVKYSDLYGLVGISSDKFWDVIADKWNEEISIEELQRLYEKESKPLNYRHILFPHVLPLLDRLKQLGLKIGLASSSPMDNIMTVLTHCEITDYFDVIVSGTDFEESKPNPQIYLSALNKLKLKPEETIAVEDSEVGINAAHSAGMYVVAKEEKRFGFDQSLANTVILDLLELLDVVEKRSL